MSGSVVVKLAPEKLNLKNAKQFLSEVEPLLNRHKTQLVLDLGQVRYMDAAGIEMLLHCLARAMKHGGDIKLAALTPQAAALLELTGSDRLFEIYEQTSDAVLSFSCFLPHAMKPPAVRRRPEKTAIVSLVLFSAASTNTQASEEDAHAA